MHSVAGNVLQVSSGKTLYIAGGGVVTATPNFSGVHDAGLRGRGVLQTTSGGAIVVEYSQNITIDGAVTVLNPMGMPSVQER